MNCKTNRFTQICSLFRCTGAAAYLPHSGIQHILCRSLSQISSTTWLKCRRFDALCRNRQTKPTEHRQHRNTRYIIHFAIIYFTIYLARYNYTCSCVSSVQSNLIVVDRSTNQAAIIVSLCTHAFGEWSHTHTQ